MKNSNQFSLHLKMSIVTLTCSLYICVWIHLALVGRVWRSQVDVHCLQISPWKKDSARIIHSYFYLKSFLPAHEDSSLWKLISYAGRSSLFFYDVTWRSHSKSNRGRSDLMLSRDVVQMENTKTAVLAWFSVFQV